MAACNSSQVIFPPAETYHQDYAAKKPNDRYAIDTLNPIWTAEGGRAIADDAERSNRYQQRHGI